MNVHAILSVKGSDVATIAPEASIGAAVDALHDRKVGALVVSTDSSSIAGILSERDVVRRLATEGAGTLDEPVSAVMSASVVTCGMNDTVHDLMGLMTGERIRHLPVVDDNGALAGIVSIGDVVKFRLDELQAENDELYGYIQGR
ncbi:MAG: CBS domain-containing protein [Actinomycetota bacterium]